MAHMLDDQNDRIVADGSHSKGREQGKKRASLVVVDTAAQLAESMLGTQRGHTRGGRTLMSARPSR